MRRAAPWQSPFSLARAELNCGLWSVHAHIRVHVVCQWVSCHMCWPCLLCCSALLVPAVSPFEPHPLAKRRASERRASWKNKQPISQLVRRRRARLARITGSHQSQKSKHSFNKPQAQGFNSHLNKASPCRLRTYRPMAHRPLPPAPSIIETALLFVAEHRVGQSR